MSFFHRLKFGKGLIGMLFGIAGEATVTMPDGSVLIGQTLTLDPLYYYPTLALWALVAYLLGSLNFGMIISKRRYHDDIRNYGSGNAGMTNMLRTYGKGPALLTLLGDFMKGVVSVLLGMLIAGQTCAYLAGLCCMIGHAFPIFYRFRGGKGVATAAAVMLCLEPLVCLVCFVVFLLIVLWTKYVSLASVMGLFVYPMVLNGMYFSFLHRDMAADPRTRAVPVLYATAMMVLVVFQHRSNLKRLFEGEERKTDLTKLFKKKKKEEETPD